MYIKLSKSSRRDYLAIGGILEENSPKVLRNTVYEELRKSVKMIKSALKDGWSSLQLAEKLKTAGVGYSKERIGLEILNIAGV